METNKIFEYKIDDFEIEIRKSQNTWDDSQNPLFEGFKQAICEYLCYPYDVLSLRLDIHSKIEFKYDSKLLKSVEITNIINTTKERILEFLLINTDREADLISEYIIKPCISDESIDCWCDLLKRDAEKVNVKIRQHNVNDETWIEFSYDLGKEYKFYGKYKECQNEADILLVSLPGYRAEWNDLSAYYDLNCDILQLSPLGYNTPWGYDNSKLVKGAWPVLYDTVVEFGFYSGYNKWFLECIMAINTIKKENQKIIFIGTSQGGGTSIVLGSIFNDITIGIAAEMPFLIGFANKNYEKVCSFVAANINSYEKPIYNFYAKERLYCIDPLSHIERIKFSTLLVSGEKDTECPAIDIYELYEGIQSNKQYIELKNTGHGYTKDFEKIAKNWMTKLY